MPTPTPPPAPTSSPASRLFIGHEVERPAPRSAGSGVPAAAAGTERRPVGPPGTAVPPADAPDVVRLVDDLLRAAVRAKASDLHLEASEDGVRVRHRVDGVMREIARLPRAVGPPLVSRLKILAALDIADRMRPQDGRAQLVVDGRRVEARVSVLPAARGENVVLRLQDPEAALESLDALGLGPAVRAHVERLLDAREGLVLVTGPTGSGKTTTLYAALRLLLARGGLNVVTVEDPVERRLPGAVQVQVHERAGLGFAAALRSILRQDPDVVLVGEVRDRETAAVAAQAALTGHLVLATLHTLDAAGAVARLADVGVEPFRLAAALRGVIAQRLVRALCPACRVRVPAGWRDARLGGCAPEGEVVWTASRTGLAPAGGPCGRCGGAGYRGRLAVPEVLVADAALAERIARGASAASLAGAAHAAGMTSLWANAVERVRAGATSVDELLRVLEPPPRAAEPARAAASRMAGAPSRPLPDLDAHFELA